MKIAINTLAMKSFKHGMGTYIGNLVNNLLQLDQENEYLIYVSAINFPLFKIPENHKVKFKFIPRNRVLRLFWEQTLLPLDLWREKVDLFHGPAFTTPLIKTCKQLITVHDLTWWTHPQTHEKIKVLYFRTMIALCTRRADFITVNSISTNNDLMRILGVPEKKIVLIYHAANERFQPITNQSLLTEIREKYQLPSHFILFVSVLEPRKNLEGLITAFSQLRQRQPDFPYQLVVVGGKGHGWKNERIFALVDQLKLNEFVSFLGLVSDEALPVLYNLADLFVLPSFYEGFGVPVLEAMMSGCPVVISKTGSLPEIAGAAAILIDPHNINELSFAIEKVLSDQTLQKQLSEKGLLNAQRFSWQKTAGQTLNLYHQISQGKI